MNQQAIRTVKIKGKDYVDVAERVRLCHADEGFSMLKEEYLEIAGQHIIRVYIDVKGKQYIGDAEIKMNAKPGTADYDSPVSCAQTSALGRALGFASYGSLESIASADEVVRNVSQNPKPETSGLTLEAVQKRAVSIGIAQTRTEWQLFNAEVFGSFVPDEKLRNDQEKLVQLNEEISRRAAGFSPAA
jgi:hypothetical protein